MTVFSFLTIRVFRVAAVAATLALVACAGRGAAPATHPSRPPNCALTIFPAAAPADLAIDDLGIVDITCHLDEGYKQCLRRFRTEACHRGADVVYDLPAEPRRPREAAIVYRGRIAHTRAATVAAPVADAAATDYSTQTTPTIPAAPSDGPWMEQK